MRARVRSRVSLALVALALTCALAFARDAAVAPGVDIGGERVTATHLSLADIAKIVPRAEVHASVHGTAAVWSGVPLIDLLRTAGAPTGDALRGPALALYVRVMAADGYRAVFALAELDPGTGHANVLLADQRDGKPIDDKEGPLRLIVAGDARPARWVRQVIAIDLLSAPSGTQP
jgi:DMSO/TMAO reductase YedYZ molybdopterin-dependent catalytic subunit